MSAEALLPEYVLLKLTSKARLRTVEDIEGEISPPWLYAKKHGTEALSVLRALDDKRIASRNAINLANREAAKQKRAEEKVERERKETEAREQQLERVRQEQERQRRDIENHQREYWHSLYTVRPQPTMRSPPLQGSTTYNFTEGVAMMTPAHPSVSQYPANCEFFLTLLLRTASHSS